MLHFDINPFLLKHDLKSNVLFDKELSLFDHEEIKEIILEIKFLYEKSYEKSDELADLFLSLFYRVEASLYPGESAIKEINAVISNRAEDLADIIKCELLLLLAKEYLENNEIELFQGCLEKTGQLCPGNLSLGQSEYINKFIRKRIEVEPKLKGKELILYSQLKQSATDKYDLISAIYGEHCDFTKGEKSFKALLCRLKKKINQQIILNTNNLYEIC
jgi:hypothetical protein